MGQTCFESISVIVKRLHGLLEDRNDQHGRNMVLAAYINYSCTLPHPDLSSGKMLYCLSCLRLQRLFCLSLRFFLYLLITLIFISVFCLGSPTGQYATLGRPSSLPVSKQGYQRSSSDPDLPGSTPTTPDGEVAGIFSCQLYSIICSFIFKTCVMKCVFETLKLILFLCLTLIQSVPK